MSARLIKAFQEAGVKGIEFGRDNLRFLDSLRSLEMTNKWLEMAK